MIPAVDVEDVTFSYDETVAIRNVSLTVERGDFLGLVGPNGSGKTTLLHLMLGLHSPDSGSISLFGDPVETFDAGERIGYVSQQSTNRGGTMPVTVRLNSWPWNREVSGTLGADVAAWVTGAGAACEP